MKTLKWKIGINEYDFEKIINYEIRQISRDEAKDILHNAIELSKTDTAFGLLLAELAIYVEKNNGNIICLHLCKIKSELIKAGIPQQVGDFDDFIE
jgi:hypothetical protein